MVLGIPKEYQQHALGLEAALRQEHAQAMDYAKAAGDAFARAVLPVPILGMWRMASTPLFRQPPARPSYTSAELATRIAYARGDRDVQTKAKIEDMTQRLVDSGIEFTLRTMSRKPTSSRPKEKHTEKRITKSYEARAFLETAMGSGLTLMDFADLLDVVSAPLHLKGVEMEYTTDGKRTKIINLIGRYDRTNAPAPKVRYWIPLTIQDGKVSIGTRNIDVSGYGRRLGFGVRSLLALTLFAKRHGIETWTDSIGKDGIFAWPTLGGKVLEKGINEAIRTLFELQKTEALRSLSIGSVKADVFEIANIVAHEKDVLDRDALFGWMENLARITGEPMEEIKAPYPIGRMALESSMLGVRYDTDAVLDTILHDYFPLRILSRHLTSLDEGRINAHRDFVSAYRRGLTEAGLHSASRNQGMEDSRIIRPDHAQAEHIEDKIISGTMRRVVGPGEIAIPVGGRFVKGGLCFIAGRQPLAHAMRFTQLPLGSVPHIFARV